MTTPPGATVVVMPKLSDAMEAGTIVAWLIGDGAPVSEGQDLVEIETDKAIATYQSPGDGVLHRIVSDGDTIAVGQPIAELSGSGARNGSAPSEADEAAAPHDSSDAGNGRGAPTASVDTRVAASPLARRRARAAGIDIRLVAGTARGGRVLSRDVDAYLEEAAANRGGARPEASAQADEPQPAAAEPTQRIPLTRSQLLVAERMAEAHNTIPDFQTTVEVDMEECIRLRASLKQLDGAAVTPSLNDLVIGACARALREHPKLNSSFAGDVFELHDAVHIGMAVAAEDRLLVPAIRDADKRDPLAIAAETKRLVSAVRDGSVAPAELNGATFTVSNLGMLGVDEFTAVISPPQVAILAVGAVAQRPVVFDGAMAIRSTVRVTLSADHRVIYGADAGRFLASLRRLLENPVALLLSNDS